MRIAFYLISCIFFLSSCDNNVIEVPDDQSLDLSELQGTGSFLLDDDIVADKPLRVYYHIPEGVDPESDILFAFHGNGRDAVDTRNVLIDDADQHKFILFVPYFTDEFYPGSDKYILGNVFEDGDKPSASTLLPEEEWTFSIIDVIFQKVKESLKSNVSTYDIFGHSAGAQFAHRMLYFKPNSPINKIGLSAAGWYTLMVDSIDYPYGFGSTPLLNHNKNIYLAKDLTIVVGTLDNDPNAPALRRNSRVDVQGDNRFDRAYYFYNQADSLSKQRNTTFGWRIQSVPDTGHDIDANSQVALNLMYP